MRPWYRVALLYPPQASQLPPPLRRFRLRGFTVRSLLQELNLDEKLAPVKRSGTTSVCQRISQSSKFISRQKTTPSQLMIHLIVHSCSIEETFHSLLSFMPFSGSAGMHQACSGNCEKPSACESESRGDSRESTHRWSVLYPTAAAATGPAVADPAQRCHIHS